MNIQEDYEEINLDPRTKLILDNQNQAESAIEMTQQQDSPQVNQNLKEKVTKPNRNLIQTLIHEFEILYEGLTNQEYKDYCMVKGASEQTVPLALFIPIGMIVGTSMCITGLVQNLKSGDPIIWSIIKALFGFIVSAAGLYLLLKACEIIPKVIRNPLLFGRITSYVFMSLLIFEAVFVLEFNVLRKNEFYTSEFWRTFALLIWQKFLMSFIYDYRIRTWFYILAYVYYALRVSNDFKQSIFNLHKCIIYIAIEMVLIIFNELKNYANYQLEKSMMQTSNKSLADSETVKFMIPPISMNLQQNILQIYSDVFPVAIFNSNKELLHISGIMQKSLRLEVDVIEGEQVDLLKAEIALRKLEIVHVYDNEINKEKIIKRLKRTAKFGSTCGVSETGELLHSLLHGPALQQLRNGTQAPPFLLGAQQPQEQPQPRNYQLSGDGIFEKVISDMIKKPEKSSSSGLLLQKVKQLQSKANEKSIVQEEIYFYQFHIVRLNKSQDGSESDLLLVLEDVTDLMKFSNSKQTNKQVVDNEQNKLQQICEKTRSVVTLENLITGQNTYTVDLMRYISNSEIQLAVQQQKPIHIFPQLVNFDAMSEEFQKKYEKLTNENKIKFNLTIDQAVYKKDFYTDKEKLKQILDNLIENSIKNTTEGLIKVHFAPDLRQNCITISVDDTGNGIPQTYFDGLDQRQQILNEVQSGDQESKAIQKIQMGIISSNILAKVIGPITHSKSIGGSICCSGLQIQTEQDVYTKITFSLRNLIHEESGDLFLIDEKVEEQTDELEADQDEIIERYIQYKEDTQNLHFLPRQKINIKCQIIKLRYLDCNIKKEVEPNPQIKEQAGRPKLAGMAKLQESGRMRTINTTNGRGRSLNIQTPLDEKPSKEITQCTCNHILVVNSNVHFCDIFKAYKTKISWFEQIQIVRENLTLRIINSKIKENACSENCQGFKKIIVNCSEQNIDYNELIQSIVSFYQKNKIPRSKIYRLNYNFYGTVDKFSEIIFMPNENWIEIIGC